MTQPAPPEATPTVVPSPVTTPAPPPPSALSFKALWTKDDYAVSVQAKLAEAFEDADFDAKAELAKLSEVLRLDFDPRWIVDQAPPGNDGLRIYAFFVGEMAGDVLAYVYPAQAVDPAAKSWLRYTMSRVGAVTMVEGMPRETFVNEIASEWLVMLDDGEEPEPGETPEPS